MVLPGLLIVLFLVALMLCAAEIAFVRVSEVRAVSLARTGGRRGRRLAEMIDDLPVVLNAVLFGELVAQIGAATVVGFLAVQWFGSSYVALASAVLTIVLFVYTEVIPKTFAVRQPERVALLVTYPVALLAWVLRPVVRMLVAFASLQIPGGATPPGATVTESELRWLAERAAREDQISEFDRQLIERSFRFGDRTVREIMVPRPDILSVPSDMPAEEALATVTSEGHGRLLVHVEDVDHVAGVVSATDLVRVPDTGQSVPVGDVMRDVLVVPETMTLPDLLREMRERSTHVAVAIDEYGSTAGVVTIEDLAEELVGSLTEGDRATVRLIRPSTWVVRGETPLHDLEEEVGRELPHDGWTTAGGLVTGHIGRVPRPGDEVTIGDLRFRVLVVRRRRVRLLEVSRATTRTRTDRPYPTDREAI